MRTATILALLAATPALGAERPQLAEHTRQAWVDFLIQDGDRRYQQGRVLAAIGGGAMLLGAGVSLGDLLEDGVQTDGMRPGAVLAIAGGPFLLAGLPTMVAGTGRMRKALRMEGLEVPAIPVIGAWSLMAAGAVFLPISTLFITVPPPLLLGAGGLMAMGSWGLATAQYKVNTAVDFPRPWIMPTPLRQGAGLRLTAVW